MRYKLLLMVAVVGLVAATGMPAAATTDLPFSGVVSFEGIDFNEDPDAVAARCDSPAAFSVTTTVGSGHATHLGRIDVVAEHCSELDERGNPGPYSQGVFTITAANDDVLLGTYTNGVSDFTNFPEIVFTDDFTFVDGGTGRFTEASGGGVETGVFNFFTGEIVLHMEGWISYDASNRHSS